jgi:carbonic anhydrase/acetyltransferase-like protein (isoleucine patch superfamily)
LIRSFNGKTPKIHPEAFVSEAAYVIGYVEIGAGSSVWPGSVIRGDSSEPIIIGRNTCVQDNSTIHCDGKGARIGDNVVMGHNVLCHADVVEDNVTIANGATVSNGVEIGEGAVIAAGAVVVDNTKVPAGVIMVGIPAKERGPVSEAQAERFKRTAEHYSERGRQYKAQGDLE